MTEESDWALFYTKSEARETKAIVEVIIIECDIVKSTKKPRGVGYTIVPLFYEDLPLSVEIFKGSPRDVIKSVNDPGYQPPHSGSILYYEFKPLDKQLFEPLMPLIPDNILLG